jgi:TatD DNase family protein
MSASLPQIDAHAHIETAVDPDDLAALDCAVFAMTREAREWTAIQKRDDQMTMWGVGCHPGYPDEIANFSNGRFAAALDGTALVGEVGLDSRSEAPMAAQRRVFRAVLEAVAARPRLISIHSVGASGKVLDELEAVPQRGAILHWWRGSRMETERAIELGCYFSLNGAEARRPKVLELLPLERILTETDYPFTERSDKRATRPGAVTTIESALEEAWGTDRAGVRGQLWTNLAALCRAAGCIDLLPAGISHKLLTSPRS